FSYDAGLLTAGEAVELARAAGLDQRLLAAARAAVRGVPRLHVARVRQSLAVVVADDRRAVAALGPVAAAGVAARRGIHAHWTRAGQQVVLVRGVAAPLHRLAFLGEGGVLVDLGLGRMQVAEVVRDHYALRVAPGALPDAVARVDTGRTLGLGRAEIGVPVGELRARRLGERIAVLVGAFQAAEVAALATAFACHEEGHLAAAALRTLLLVLRIGRRRHTRRNQERRRNDCRKLHETSEWVGGAEVWPQSGQKTGVHCYSRRGSALFPTRVAAPAGVERKVETAARTAERGGIGVELGGVAGAFLVEERLDRRALVPAGLEVDHPEPSVAVAKHPVHHVGPPSFGRVDAYTAFAARERVRLEGPAPALAAQRGPPGRGNRLDGALELGRANPAALEVARECFLERSDARRVPAAQLVLGDALQPAVHDRADVARGLAGPGEFDRRGFGFP